MADPSPPVPPSSGPPSATVLRPGDRGVGVADLRARLEALGLLGPARSSDADTFDAAVDRAVRAFQQDRGLTADGLVGPATFRALEEARWELGDRVLVHLPGSLQRGDDVFALQRRLLDLGFKVGRVDGSYGAATESAVKEFQRNIGVPADGTCGPATLKALGRLAPLVQGGSPNALRAQEHLRQQGPLLPGKVVVIDAAPNQAPDADLRSMADEVTADLARRVEGRLVALGVQAYLTGLGAGVGGQDEEDRADFANRAEAHLCISLQVDASEAPEVCGTAAYFYGIESRGIRSSIGERFAGLVQREIVARTDLADLRTHARSWDLLRHTRMPAVRVDIGYVTNPGDTTRLADPAFRDVVAEAVVVAVQRMYLTPEDDPHTGVLRLDELRAMAREQGLGLP